VCLDRQISPCPLFVKRGTPFLDKGRTRYGFVYREGKKLLPWGSFPTCRDEGVVTPTTASGSPPRWGGILISFMNNFPLGEYFWILPKLDFSENFNIVNRIVNYFCYYF